MIRSFARSRNLDRLIGELELLIDKTGDYFDDELTSQLNMTKAWLQDAMVMIRLHELQRLRLAQDIARFARNEAHEVPPKVSR